MVLEIEKNHSAEDNDIMTTEEVALFLKVSISAVRRWSRDGKLKGHKMGGTGDWRYLKKEIMAFLFGNNN